MTQTGEPVARAVERADAALLNAPVLEAVIARREASCARPGDERHAAALARELCGLRDAAGSWGGDLARTAEALLLLRALVPAPPVDVMAAAEEARAWIRDRRGRPGAFAEGCAPERHALHLCEHFMRGFYSPAPADVDVSGLTLATGVRFGGDAAARLGASCIALQALLRWGEPAESVADHLDAVRRIVTGVAVNAPTLLTTTSYVSAAAALAEAPRSPATDAAVAAALDRLALLQRADGSWRGVDVFHVLQMTLSAAQRGHRTDASEAALRRAAAMLAVLQREDGQWGRETGPERTLTGWRTLRYVIGSLAGTEAMRGSRGDGSGEATDSTAG